MLIDWAGLSLDEFPHLEAWLNKLLARPGFERGRNVPAPHTALNQKNLSEEELNKAAEKTRAWVQKGMAEDKQ